jgi:phage terminase small subunit
MWVKTRLLPQDLDRLTGACIALDRAHAARETLAKEGAVFTDRFDQPREHPAVKIESTSWNTFRLLVRELGIDAEVPADSRPATSPRGYR